MSNAICALGSCSVNAVAGDRIFIGQSTIGTSLFELETPYADPHVRCCERCDAKHPPTRFYHKIVCGLHGFNHIHRLIVGIL